MRAMNVVSVFAVLFSLIFACVVCRRNNNWPNAATLRPPWSLSPQSCQCRSYTWVDTYGRQQGNCKSSDIVGRWCYVNPQSSCTDIQRSSGFRELYYSYQACSTPSTSYWDLNRASHYKTNENY